MNNTLLRNLWPWNEYPVHQPCIYIYCPSPNQENDGNFWWNSWGIVPWSYEHLFWQTRRGPFQLLILEECILCTTSAVCGWSLSFEFGIGSLSCDSSCRGFWETFSKPFGINVESTLNLGCKYTEINKFRDREVFVVNRFYYIKVFLKNRYFSSYDVVFYIKTSILTLKNKLTD